MYLNPFGKLVNTVKYASINVVVKTIDLFISYDHANPLSTTFSSVPISGVAFPAITVDFGAVVNPDGFAEKLIDSVQLNCPFDGANETGQFQKVFEPFFRLMK